MKAMVLERTADVIEGELADPALPLIPGHQAVGVVSQVGTGVSERMVGERVGIAWLQQTCGLCEFCTSGRENLCERARFTGYQVDGVCACPGSICLSDSIGLQ